MGVSRGSLFCTLQGTGTVPASGPPTLGPVSNLPETGRCPGATLTAFSGKTCFAFIAPQGASGSSRTHPVGRQAAAGGET